jgi:hypothetical protein
VLLTKIIEKQSSLPSFYGYGKAIINMRKITPLIERTGMITKVYLFIFRIGQMLMSNKDKKGVTIGAVETLLL